MRGRLDWEYYWQQRGHVSSQSIFNRLKMLIIIGRLGSLVIKLQDKRNQQLMIFCVFQQLFLFLQAMDQEFEQFDAIDFKKAKDKTKKKAQKEKAKEQQNKQAEVAKRNETRYKNLLARITDTLTKNNPDLAENTKILLKPPKVTKISNKKTAIENFVALCKQLDRHPEHVMNFFLEDLGGSSGSIGNSGLIIKTMLSTTNVENLFKKYITQYVQCQLCRRQNTQLIKDEKMRLWNLHCNSCKSNRSVRTIKGAEKKYADYEVEIHNMTEAKQGADQ